MSQNQSSAGSLWMGIPPNLMSPNFAAMCKKSAENCSAMQKEWMETLEHANRDWVARLEAEAKLSSDFAARVVSAKANPEAAAAALEDCQKCEMRARGSPEMAKDLVALEHAAHRTTSLK